MKKLNVTLSLILGVLLMAGCNNGSEQSEAGESTAVQTSSTEEDGWVYLVKGNSLDNWTQLNGKATYEVNDGVVTGTTKLGEPNSFMTTNKEYDDFILEYEVKVDPRMNSGVQIRSNAYDQDTTITVKNSEGKMVERKIEKDRVHGYQVEIDPSERAYSGGIYDEARRGWLFDLSENEAARKAFKNGEWNKFRVEARGDTIKTWVNNVPAANLVDTMTASGFIGLQVHSTKEEEPMQVQWRNIRIRELD